MTNFVMPKKIINSNKAFPSLGCQCDATRPYWGFLFVKNCKKNLLNTLISVKISLAFEYSSRKKVALRKRMKIFGKKSITADRSRTWVIKGRPTSSDARFKNSEIWPN